MKTHLKDSKLRHKLEKIATENEWTFLCYKEGSEMISFTKTYKGNKARINIWLTTKTVSTALTHPKQGKTQLYRKRADMNLIHKIFKNPRVHTNRGYKKK